MHLHVEVVACLPSAWSLRLASKIARYSADPNLPHDEVAVIDHALTRPWTVMKDYRRNANPRPRCTEENYSENNHIDVGQEDYMLSSDGFLMPTSQLAPISSRRENDDTRIPIGQKPERSSRPLAVAPKFAGRGPSFAPSSTSQPLASHCMNVFTP
jgi:hypothetical protein